MKGKLKKIQILRNLYFLLRTTSEFFKFHPILFVDKFCWYFRQLYAFQKLNKNSVFRKIEYLPCLFDNTDYTPVEPIYFFQDCWASKHIFELKPKYHYDIGSSIKTIGLLSQFVPITFIDIRPPELRLQNLSFIKASILDLPFKDNSIESLSSLCVVEHIGLGRYGDSLDPFGSEKAISELRRVLKAGGILLISVPVDSENKVYFNAHRAFTRDYILKLFDGFDFLDEKYIYGNSLCDEYDVSKGFGTGLYMLRKK